MNLIILPVCEPLLYVSRSNVSILEWKCESGDYFGWDEQEFSGYDIATAVAESVHFCKDACNANAECEAFTYKIDTQECTLKSVADASWKEIEGSQSAYKCNHVPSSSPNDYPEFYLWNSCASQLSQLDDAPMGAFIPQCTENGAFESQQCHGSTGYCWCVDEYGNKLTDPVFGSVSNGCSGMNKPNNTYELSRQGLDVSRCHTGRLDFFNPS